MRKHALLLLTTLLLTTVFAAPALACGVCRTNGNAIKQKLNDSEFGIYGKRVHDKINTNRTASYTRTTVKRAKWSWNATTCKLRYWSPFKTVEYTLKDADYAAKTSTGLKVVCKSGKKCVRTQMSSPSVTATSSSKSFSVLNSTRRSDVKNLFQTLIPACGGGGGGGRA